MEDRNIDESHTIPARKHMIKLLKQKGIVKPTMSQATEAFLRGCAKSLRENGVINIFS